MHLCHCCSPHFCSHSLLFSFAILQSTPLESYCYFTANDMVALPATDSSANLPPAVVQALLNGPAAPPPNGAAALEKDPPNFHPVIVAVLTICHFFAALAILLRMYTKVLLIRSTGLEDCGCHSVKYSKQLLILLRLHIGSMGEISDSS